MMPVDEQQLRRFVNDLNSDYEQDSMLTKHHEVIPYDEDRDSGESFIQIGRRTNLPKRFFAQGDNYSTFQISSQFAKSIVTGEKGFIARSFIDEVDGEVESAELEENLTFDLILEAYRQVPDPDYILIPIYKEFHRTVSQWARNQESWMDGFRTLEVGTSKVQILWVSTDLDIRDIVVVDTDYTRIIRKEGGQSSPPPEVDVIQEYEEFSRGKPVLCTFGQDSEEFDFVYRTVLSEPDLTEYSGFVIEVPDDLELSE